MRYVADARKLKHVERAEHVSRPLFAHAFHLHFHAQLHATSGHVETEAQDGAKPKRNSGELPTAGPANGRHAAKGC